MKVLLYTELLNKIKKSGIGKATMHQIESMKENKIEYTLDTSKIEDVDIVHINYYGIKSYFLAKRARKLNKKVVYHAHSTEEDFRNSFIFSNQLAPIFKRWISKCYRLGDVIITPTEYSKKLLENYKLNKDIEVISNGIDLDNITKDIKGGKEFRKKYNIKDNEKVIISVGLYLKRKGLLDFVRLAEIMPEYKFIWFGYSPLWLAPKEIKNVIKNHSKNLIFAGYVEQEELIKAYSGCDLFTFLSYEETEGIVLLEALATRTKTLIRDIPIYSNWLENGVDIYKGKSIDEFKILIKWIVENKTKDLTENGYEKVKDKSILETGKKLKNLYEKILVEK